MFCPTIGYIQGMSDMLAPILAISGDESDAFWCFAGLMRRTIFVSTTATNVRSSAKMDRHLVIAKGKHTV